jgi:hypothetical protein
LERLADARKTGAAIFAIDQGDPELDELAHEALAVLPAQAPVSFDGAQHLVSLAIGEAAAPRPQRPGMRSQLARLLDAVSGTQPG